MLMIDECETEISDPQSIPHIKKAKQQITMNMHTETVEYFKNMAKETGIPYQTLINLYLDECVSQKKRLQFL